MAAPRLDCGWAECVVVRLSPRSPPPTDSSAILGVAFVVPSAAKRRHCIHAQSSSGHHQSMVRLDRRCLGPSRQPLPPRPFPFSFPIPTTSSTYSMLAASRALNRPRLHSLPLTRCVSPLQLAMRVTLWIAPATKAGNCTDGAGSGLAARDGVGRHGLGRQCERRPGQRQRPRSRR